jgi:uncharacterized membrane protein YuzA (DUF378 family)
MVRTGLSLVLVLLLLAGLNTGAVGSKQPVVTPLNYQEIGSVTIGYVDPSATCQIGNLNAPVYAIGNFLLPPEEYQLRVDPAVNCVSCYYGVMVTRVHVLLQTSEPCEIDISLNVDEAVPYGGGCMGPGPEWSNSGVFHVIVGSAGVWNISMPFPTPCLASSRRYLLSVGIANFQCETGSMPDLVTDGLATLCMNWNNFGTGWYDLLGQWPTWPGNLLVYADVQCCTPPVPTEKTTWGAIKALYRN